MIARYVARRTRARAGLVTLLALTVALIAGALAGTPAYLAAASLRAVGAALAAAEPDSRYHQLTTRLADDAATQSDGVAALLEDVLPAPEVWHTVRSFPLRTDSDARLVLLADSGHRRPRRRRRRSVARHPRRDRPPRRRRHVARRRRRRHA